MYRVPTMPFVGHLKPLENDVDAMNMVKCIRCYNEVEVYVMFLDDYENAIGNKGDGGGGDNEVGNFDVGDKVDGAVSEEDNAHRVHFGCSENKQEKRYDRVKLKERRKGKAGASGVSPSRVGGSGVDPSGVSPSEAGASGVGLIGIDARGVGSTWLMQVGLILVQVCLLHLELMIGMMISGSERRLQIWLVHCETRPRYPQYHPLESFSEVYFELEMQFATKKDDMDAIKLYSIFKGVAIKFIKNGKVRNPLLPYWGTCFDVPGPIGEESSTSSIDAWSVEEESFASLPSMVFDMLDSLEEESSTSFTRDVLLETLERFRKSLLLPNRTATASTPHSLSRQSASAASTRHPPHATLSSRCDYGCATKMASVARSPPLLPLQDNVDAKRCLREAEDYLRKAIEELQICLIISFSSQESRLTTATASTPHSLSRQSASAASTRHPPHATLSSRCDYGCATKMASVARSPPLLPLQDNVDAKRCLREAEDYLRKAIEELQICLIISFSSQESRLTVSLF
nr:hypothetical protein CFP56_61428 [Quercus suber]